MSWIIAYTTPDSIKYILNDNVNSYILPNGMFGFGVLRIQVASERRPYLNGMVRLGGPYTPAREMGVGLEIMRSSLSSLVAFNRALASNVSAYLDPETLGTLNITTPDGLLRDISCWMVEWPDLDLSGPVDGRVSPMFWAPDPWFFDPTQVVEALPMPANDGFSIPLTIPASVAATSVDGYIFIANDGDVDTWPTIRITGPADNPVIVNDTTGKTMDITQAQDVDDYIEIDMENATVNWWDNSGAALNNIIENISDASEFWPLRRGNNTIHITADNATGGTITVSYYKRYQSA